MSRFRYIFDGHSQKSHFLTGKDINFITNILPQMFAFAVKRMGSFLTVGEASNVLPALAGMSWADVMGKCPTKSKKIYF